jgi:DNA-binding MarR family transcriptional regulator
VEDLRDGIAAAVRRFIADAVLHNHAVAQAVGLGASDAQFVGLLGQHGPLTPGRLAALSGLTTGTVTGVVDRLERAGFVRRERDEGDRRKVLVVLEPAAMATLAEHYREHAEHLDRVLAARTPEELRTIAAFLDDLLGPDAAGGG